jgi:hypothetical protein
MRPDPKLLDAGVSGRILRKEAKPGDYNLLFAFGHLPSKKEENKSIC